VTASVQIIQVENSSRAMPSKRPKRCCGSLMRNSDHTSTTLPSRQANSTWNGSNAGNAAPPSSWLMPSSCVRAKAKLHGVAKGAVTIKS